MKWGRGWGWREAMARCNDEGTLTKRMMDDDGIVKGKNENIKWRQCKLIK